MYIMYMYIHHENLSLIQSHMLIYGNNLTVYIFLMRDEKEEGKKQARSNKQTRQSNTAHSLYNVHVYM